MISIKYALDTIHLWFEDITIKRKTVRDTLRVWTGWQLSTKSINRKLLIIIIILNDIKNRANGFRVLILVIPRVDVME